MPILIKSPSCGSSSAIGNLKDMTWGEILEISENGEAKNVFKPGDEIPVTLSGAAPMRITMQIAGFDHDELADGSGKAGITFISKEAFLESAQWGGYTTTQIHWPNTILRQNVKNVKDLLPTELQSAIKDVYKLYGWNTTNPVQSVVDDIFVPSASELGLSLASDRYMRRDEGARYELFAENADIIKTYLGSAVDYWTRSSEVDSESGKVDNRKWYIKASGSAAYADSHILKKSCIMFCV